MVVSSEVCPLPYLAVFAHARESCLTKGPPTNPDPIPTTPPSTASTPAPTTNTPPASTGGDQHHADPEEVDISNHYYQPTTTNRVPTDPNNISESQLRQMMLGLDRASPNASGPDAEDPMMKMLQQMMGGAGAGGPGGMPNPFLGGNGQANPFAQAGGPFGAMGQQQQQQQPQAAAGPDIYTAIWRILHFLLALGLGLYIALLTRFTGTKLDRERGAVAGAGEYYDNDEAVAMRRYFLWTFATAETVLLTSRFFLDRGRAPQGGALWMIVGFLPDGPWKGYLAMAMRYLQILGTLRADILGCVFVLGVCAWLRG